MKREQMWVCPKAEGCIDDDEMCSYHKHPHKRNLVCRSNTVKCPACIPLPMRKPRRQPEQQLQQAYVIWLRSKGILHCAIPGGMRVAIGTAMKMKRAGYVRGFPDIIIPEPRHGYFGLFVELKADTGTSTPQKEWHKILKEKGYEVIVNPSRRGFQESLDWLIAKTEAYLGEAC